MQHRLKPASGAARTRVVATELLDELLVAVDDALAASDVGFAGIAFAALTRALERTTVRSDGWP
jgi:hypothetical protein